MKDKKDKKKTSHPLYRIIHPWGAPIVKLLTRMHIEGKENIPKEGNFLLCANHYSNMDAVVLAAAFPRKRQLHFMAKIELFKVPFVRGLVTALGAIKVDRFASDVGAIKNTINTLKDNKVVGIFPQGIRYPFKAPEDTPIRPGAAMIAVRANVPVLPVLVQTKNMKFRFFRRTNVYIGKLITLEELMRQGESNTDYRPMVEYIFAQICSLSPCAPLIEGDAQRDHHS